MLPDGQIPADALFIGGEQQPVCRQFQFRVNRIERDSRCGRTGSLLVDQRNRQGSRIRSVGTDGAFFPVRGSVPDKGFRNRSFPGKRAYNPACSVPDFQLPAFHRRFGFHDRHKTHAVLYAVAVGRKGCRAALENEIRFFRVQADLYRRRRTGVSRFVSTAQNICVLSVRCDRPAVRPSVPHKGFRNTGTKADGAHGVPAFRRENTGCPGVFRRNALRKGYGIQPSVSHRRENIRRGSDRCLRRGDVQFKIRRKCLRPVSVHIFGVESGAVNSLRKKDAVCAPAVKFHGFRRFRAACGFMGENPHGISFRTEHRKRPPLQAVLNRNRGDEAHGILHAVAVG